MVSWRGNDAMAWIREFITFFTSLRSSLFRFLSGKRESHEGMGTAGTNFLLSTHTFARLPLDFRFLSLRGKV